MLELVLCSLFGSNQRCFFFLKQTMYLLCFENFSLLLLNLNVAVFCHFMNIIFFLIAFCLVKENLMSLFWDTLKNKEKESCNVLLSIVKFLKLFLAILLCALYFCSQLFWEGKRHISCALTLCFCTFTLYMKHFFFQNQI